MPSYYTVIQYMPDPVAGECVNIGVIVFGEGVVRSRFLRDWHRVQHFGDDDIGFLKDLARRASAWSRPDAPLPCFGTDIRLDEGGIRSIAGRWMNSIQFSEPRASLLAPDRLLIDIAPRFLREPMRVQRGFRDHRAAAGLATRRIRAALTEVAGSESDKLVRTHDAIAGELDEHRFDVAVRNGKLLFAAQGLSFEAPASRELERELGETAWAIADVRNHYPNVPLGVVVLPPKTNVKIFDRATHIFGGLNAEVVLEPHVDEWAERMASSVVGALGA